MVYGGAKTKEDLRRVGGAILALLDQMVVLLGLSSSAEEGGEGLHTTQCRERERELLGAVSESGMGPTK